MSPIDLENKVEANIALWQHFNEVSKNEIKETGGFLQETTEFDTICHSLYNEVVE